MPYSTQRRPGSANRSPRAYQSRPSTRRPSKSKFSKQYINPSRFVKAAQPAADVVEYIPQHAFADFALHPLLKQNIADKGYVTPSPIQDQTISQGLTGKDIIGIANTGTGKTAAFMLPTLHRLLEEPHARALIIAPTRELAQQIEEEARSLAKGSGLFRAVLIGGSSMGEQLRDLKSLPSIVIGTPGRIKDHLERGSLDLSTFNIVTLDEVDRMLDMGFIADIRFILDSLAHERQSFFFSATLDPKIRELINTFLSDPVVVSVKTGETSDSVEQDVVRYNASHEKIGKLHDILTQEHVGKTLVFDETQRSVERLAKELQERGFKVDSIHGGKTQGQRTRALKQFKESKLTVLVATDVAARGIDVADITHVINYTTPQTYEDYVHRIGRAGRAGRTGYALTFIDQ
ncbi:MAG: putative box helicase domain protein [Candidatus Saccharibacteria bacterium]|nr:putative box helicase domain protein [Candidatus Saccharibacteria bacterium]